MIQFTDGTKIDHCFCYMTEGQTCKRKDCSGLKPTAQYVFKGKFNNGARAPYTGEEKMFGNKKDKQVDLEFFTVFDSKAKYYEAPLMAENKDTLLRDILNNFKNPESQQKNKYYINAEDYAIYRIGYFSKVTGSIDPNNLEHIANLHDLRALVGPSNQPTLSV